MSEQYNYAGREIVVDKIRELGVSEERASSLKRSVDAILLKRDYTSLYSQLEKISNDSLITPKEKEQLKITRQSLDSEYATLVSRAIDLGYSTYNLDEAHNNITAVLDQVFANMNVDYILPEGVNLSSLFEAYYTQAQITDETLYSLTTGILNGIDNRTKFSLSINGNTGIEHGGTTTLTCVLFENGEDVTNDIRWDNEDFYWLIKGQEERHYGKSLTVNYSDLQDGTLTVYCTFLHYTNTIRTIYYHAFTWVNIGKSKNGEDAIRVVLNSTTGTIFKPNGINLNGRISAQVLQGERDVTGMYPSYKFNWKRLSEAGSVEDERWNTSSKAIATKYIDITSEDCIGRTTFICELDLGE